MVPDNYICKDIGHHKLILSRFNKNKDENSWLWDSHRHLFSQVKYVLKKLKDALISILTREVPTCLIGYVALDYTLFLRHVIYEVNIFIL
jgi:hypothetical protein